MGKPRINRTLRLVLGHNWSVSRFLLHFSSAGIYLEGGEHRDFSPPRLISPPIENSTKALEHVWFPPPEEPAIDNPILIPVSVLINSEVSLSHNDLQNLYRMYACMHARLINTRQINTLEQVGRREERENLKPYACQRMHLVVLWDRGRCSGLRFCGIFVYTLVIVGTAHCVVGSLIMLDQATRILITAASFNCGSK